LAVLPQNQMERILEGELKAEGVDVRWRHRLAHVEHHDNGAEVTVNKLVMDGVGYAVAHTEYVVGRSDHFVVPFVIGADGHKSLVRRQLPIEFEALGEADHFAVFEFKTDYDFKNEVRVVLDEESTNVLWPLPDGYCRWSFQLPRYRMGDDDREKEEDSFEIVGPGRFPIMTQAFLEKRLRTRAPWFRGSIGDIRWRIIVRFEHRLAASFGSDHIWLAGDAAHLAGPVGVQSMNLGLCEAVDLANTMHALVKGNAPDEPLNEFNARRLAEWRFLLGAGGTLKAADKADAWVSGIADRLLPCLPASGDDLANMLAQLHLEMPPLNQAAVAAN
jgi:2-polyprenyl-6-methoxyphenol hydroxylase-like FAD-dependent oxidoreductase